jgi:hypothetical protein
VLELAFSWRGVSQEAGGIVETKPQVTWLPLMIHVTAVDEWRKPVAGAHRPPLQVFASFRVFGGQIVATTITSRSKSKKSSA